MSDPVKILIVDDSITYRIILKQVVQNLSNAVVVGTAVHGLNALEELKNNEIDLVLLDIEMPKMDGIETLGEIQKQYPHIDVIMVSGMSKKSADITIRALEAGATDFINKPDSGDSDQNMAYLKDKLEPLIELYRFRKNARLSSSEHKKYPSRPAASLPKRGAKINALAIGISAGGPNALAEMIPRLPADLNIPVFLVIHMPAYFTASLAERLNQRSQIHVKEAEDGEEVCNNTLYIAPGGYHMAVATNKNTRRVIQINQDPPENSCRPAADVLFRSVASVYGSGLLSVVMTGMGKDGLAGVKEVKKHRGYCLTQSAETCVVYGMPKSVDEAELSDEQVGLTQLSERITELVRAV